VSGAVRLWYATVYVRDFSRALAFYRDTLGLPLRFADDKFGFASFATAGAGFTIAQVDDKDAEQLALVGRHTGVAFGVDDIDETYEAWRAKGVEFPLPPTKQPWGGTLAQLRDSEGNLVSLDQYREEEPA
jgi:predicted enzyme related to lactoylglutathione lyase